MANMTNFLEAALRNHLFRGVAYTAPATLYVALFTSAPSDTGGGTEVSGGAYARVGVAASTANWSAVSATDGLCDNLNTLTFPTATANWGTVTHAALFDAATGGNMLVWMPLDTPTTVNSGLAATLPPGQLAVTFA